MYDAYKEESFILRGILLWTISDYPALGNLSGNVIKGYNACTICIDETKATRMVNYRKTVIMRHRRWFPIIILIEGRNQLLITLWRRGSPQFH